jgi:four helix bundle protein
MRDFRSLKVWEKAHELALAIYQATAAFPREEVYGLTSQMRRAAVSVPTNIAEGCGRNTEAELARFLEVAMGSASELEYLLLLAHDLKLLNDLDHARLSAQTEEVKRMLAPFIRTLRG